MDKALTCIECPLGCRLSVDVENCKVVKVTGNKCPKGETFAIAEVENPTRILTASVLAEGLALRMVPVRTDAPIPRGKISEAMQEVRKLVVTKPLGVGHIIVRNFLGLRVNLIATRKVT